MTPLSAPALRSSRRPEPAPHWRDPQSLASDLLPLADALCLLAAASLASVLLAAWHTPGPAQPFGAAGWMGALVAPFVLYDPRFGRSASVGRASTLLGSHALRFGVFAAAVLLLGSLGPVTFAVAGAGLALWLALGLLSTALLRAATAAALRRLQRQGRLSEAVAVVGAGAAADRLLHRLRADRPGRIDLLGVFDDAPAPTGATPVTGSIAQLIALGRSRPIDWILLAEPTADAPGWQATLQRLRVLPVRIGLFPLPAGLLAERPIERWNGVVKAAEDRLLGGLLTLLLLPLLAVIALAIRLDSPGPVLFRQRRHALNNDEFDIFKFRSMRWDAPAEGDALTQTTRGDARITRVGRVLRASSLDELPQLFNVMQGSMSLVGPRPHATQMRTEQRLGCEITAQYAHRHRVKPGITGWAQVNGARGATDTTAQLQRRVELDLHYIEHWSLWLDLKILALTWRAVVRRTNAF